MILGVLYLELGLKMPRSMVGTMVDNFKIVLPYFKPIRGILVAFCITGYLIYKIPISGKPGYTCSLVAYANMTKPWMPVRLVDTSLNFKLGSM